MRFNVTVAVPYPGNDVVRNWAWREGYTPAERGPIPWDIRRAFDKARTEAMRAAAEAASERFLEEAKAWSILESSP